MKKLLVSTALILSFGLFFTACNDDNKNAKTEQLAAGETYTCPMHNEVMSDEPGKCPKCGMNLEKRKMTEEQMKLKETGNFVKPNQ